MSTRNQPGQASASECAKREAADLLAAYRAVMALTEAQYDLLQTRTDYLPVQIVPALRAALADSRMLTLAEIEAIAPFDNDDMRYGWMFGHAPGICWFSAPGAEREALIRAAISRGTPITTAERRHTERHFRDHPDRVY